MRLSQIFKQCTRFFEENLFLTAFLLSLVLLGTIFIVVLRIQSSAKKRKRKRGETERSLEFALPSQENTFVRARLNTVLRVPEEKQGETEEASFEELPKLSHARELLAKIKASPLSGAERLETEELSKALNFFLKKETLTVSDLRVLNDTFSRILKLSAKYAV